MGSVMVNYVTRVRVRRCAVFTLELTAVGGVESVVVVGHCWGSGCAEMASRELSYK